ncbi:MAG: Rhodanese domain protein [Frankiales bacterium]|jgi:rhodanese-related sulfurtransferase|nr:Rhodanese domain protein [Frankiales bacterium]
MHPHEIPTVEPREVVDEILLDVREDDEWAAGRAPHAVHIPLYDLPERLAEIPEGRPLSVVCRVGGRSAQATTWLRAQGVEARNVRGGMLAWAAAGLPIEGDSDRAWIV